MPPLGSRAEPCASTAGALRPNFFGLRLTAHIPRYRDSDSDVADRGQTRTLKLLARLESASRRTTGSSNSYMEVILCNNTRLSLVILA